MRWKATLSYHRNWRNLVKTYLCGLWWGSCHISDELNRCILSDWQLTLQIYVDSWDQFCHNSRFPIESVWLIMEFQLLWSKVVRLCANMFSKILFSFIEMTSSVGETIRRFQKFMYWFWPYFGKKRGELFKGGYFTRKDINFYF